MHNPSDFQEKVFNTLACLGLSQVQISNTGNGYSLRTSAPYQRILYFILRLNSLCKLTFLVLLSCGAFQAEFEFFEKMAILLWFLIIGLVLISERIYCRKYPFFEILTAWWKVENAIFMQLGKPNQYLEGVRALAVKRVWFQGIVALVGILAVIVQYDADPKYCVFAYSLFPQEDELLKWVIGIHEVLFLCHAWLVYGSVIYLSSVIGAEFTFNVQALNNVMDDFLKYGCQTHPTNRRGTRCLYKVKFSSSVTYDMEKLVEQYNHVYAVVTQLNNFAAYNFLYMHACSYVQMVSDVFQMIQILRSPDADFLAVLFFAEDMMVCMYMLYRCFKSMAFLQPAAVEFLEKFSIFLGRNWRVVKDHSLFRRIKRNLRVVQFKVGPSLVGPWTVGTAMDVLLQYYICVALW